MINRWHDSLNLWRIWCTKWQPRTCSCADLDMYVGFMAMKTGDFVGHEFLGVVEDLTPKVKSLKKGDRVVACGLIACFNCWACKEKSFYICESSNSSKEIHLMVK